MNTGNERYTNQKFGFRKIATFEKRVTFFEKIYT